MPSSYSSRLRLELPADGEQAGLWGQTTNRNLGTLIETSIAGVRAISMPDADYTLTTSNGLDDDARYAVLQFSGSLTAPRDVIAPDVTKLYVVRNNTNQTLNIKTATGTARPVVSGRTSYIFIDGLNASDAVNDLTSLNTGNLAYTGTLTGGTGTVSLGATQFVKTADGRIGVGTATPADFLAGVSGQSIRGVTSAGLSLSDAASSDFFLMYETANSLRFFRPTIGDFAAFNNTGRFALGSSSPTANLSINQTGSGGQATAINLLSNDIEIARIGIDPNNSVGLRLSANAPGADNIRLQTSGVDRVAVNALGNVGIGNASPAFKVDIVGPTGNGVAYTAGSVSNILGEQSGGGFIGTVTNHPLDFATAGTGRLRIDTAGNAGLGVIPSAWGNSFRALDIGNASAIWNLNNVGLYLDSNSYESATGSLYKVNAFASRYVMNQVTNGSHQWLTAPSGTAGAPITFTQAMTLTNSGNLLVGTTLTEDLFGRTHRFVNGSGSSTLSVLGNGGGAAYVASIGSDAHFGVASPVGANVVFNTALGERARITSAGNLLVGTAVDRGYKLVSESVSPEGLAVVRNVNTAVSGDAGTFLDIGALDGSTFAPGARLTGVTSTTAGYLTIATRAAGVLTERARITTGGNLLVGTTTDFAKLAVNGSIYAAAGNDVQLGNLNNTNAASISSDSSDTSAALVFKTAAAGLARTERARITSAGNLLVGNTIEGTSRLQITGDTDASARATITGSSGAQASLRLASGAAYEFASISGGGVRFIQVDVAEHARFTAAGNLLVGTTGGTGKLTVSALGQAANFINSNATLFASLRPFGSGVVIQGSAAGPSFGPGLYFDQGGGGGRASISTLRGSSTGGNLIFAVDTNSTPGEPVEVARITSAGNLLVGTIEERTGIRQVIRKDESNSTGGALVLENRAVAPGRAGSLLFAAGRDVANPSYVAGIWAETAFGGLGNESVLVFGNQGLNGGSDPLGVTERARITSGGFSKFSNTGAYGVSNVVVGNENVHQFLSTENAATLLVSNNSGGALQNAILTVLDGTVNGAHFESRNDDDGAVVYRVLANGNVQNTNNSYGAISDAKLKNVTATNLSYWEKYKLIEWVKYTLKADDTNQEMLGVIAQQVQGIFPGLIQSTPDIVDVTKTREVTKTVPVTTTEVQETTRTEIVLVDGKYVQKTIVESTEVQVPVFDEFPVYDENGDPVMQLVTPAVEGKDAVLDEEGNVVEPAVEAQDAVYAPLTHQVPRTETVTETETYTEKEPNGEVTLSVKYSILGHIADVVLQEAMARIEALEQGTTV